MAKPTYQYGANMQVRCCLIELTWLFGYDVFERDDDFDNVKDFFDWECAYCGKKKKLQVDHIVGLNKDDVGFHCLGNIVPACASCNSSKRDVPVNEFISDKKRIKKIKDWMRRNDYPSEFFQQNPQIVESVSKKLNAMYQKMTAPWEPLLDEFKKILEGKSFSRSNISRSSIKSVKNNKKDPKDRCNRIGLPKPQYSKLYADGLWKFDTPIIKLEEYEQLVFELKDSNGIVSHTLKLPTCLIETLLDEEQIALNEKKQNFRLNFIEKAEKLFLVVRYGKNVAVNKYVQR